MRRLYVDRLSTIIFFSFVSEMKPLVKELDISTAIISYLYIKINNDCYFLLF